MFIFFLIGYLDFNNAEPYLGDLGAYLVNNLELPISFMRSRYWSRQTEDMGDPVIIARLDRIPETPFN